MIKHFCDYCGKEMQQPEGEKNKLLLWSGGGTHRLKLCMHQACAERVYRLLERVVVHTLRGDLITISVEERGKNYSEICEEMLLNEYLRGKDE